MTRFKAWRIPPIMVALMLALVLVASLVPISPVMAADTFTKLPNPAALPASDGIGVAFSHDSAYVAVAHSSSPYVTIYKRDGDTFTKLPYPDALPAGDGIGVAFSHDSAYMAVAHSSSPYITIYKTTTAPTVTTGDATDTTTDSARLNGNLDDLGTAITVDVSFEWGTTSGAPYDNETPSQALTAPGAFDFDLTGLDPGKTYYFRAKADGGDHGTGYGAEKTFATEVTPPSPHPVGGTAYPMWVILLAGLMAGASLLVLNRRRKTSQA